MKDQTIFRCTRGNSLKVPELVQGSPRVVGLRTLESSLEGVVTQLATQMEAGIAAGNDEKSVWFLTTRAQSKAARHELETARALRRKAEREVLTVAAGNLKEQGAKIKDICQQLGVPPHTARSLAVAAQSLKEATESEDAMLRLPVRQRNRLLAEGIRSVEQVGLAIENGTLEKVPNLGRRSLEDIRDWYAAETGNKSNGNSDAFRLSSACLRLSQPGTTSAAPQVSQGEHPRMLQNA